MNRLQFIIVTTLSAVIAVCILLQIILVRMSAASEMQVQQAQSTLQQGQLCFTRLQQIAGRVAQVAGQQNDQALKDLLTRQNIAIKAPAAPDASAAPAPAPAAAPSTH